MKKVFTLLCVMGSMGIAMAQGPLIDKAGTAHFFSEAPLEDIEATNKEALGAVDLEKGTLAVSILMTKFEFEKSLMQEHFNENYVESEKFPKATFKGVISDFSNLDFTRTGTIEAQAEGELEIHGVKKPFVTLVTFDVTPSSLSAKTVFELAVEDFDIEVPTLLIKNIAEIVEVTASFNFTR